MREREIKLDTADEILIATVDTAIEVGTGRTFTTPAGSILRVDEIGDEWVHLEVLVGGVARETLALPRKIRKIAREAALLRSIVEGEGGRG